MKYTVLFFLVLFSSLGICAQGYQEAYINQFMPMAIEQMQKYKIPASITLAQGLLESGSGRSRLAREGNNHFGIKCGTSWTGPYMLVNDDAPNEHFRVYKSAEQSYEDHSLFLRRNQRYARLFQLRITDYKGWAHGLKACGYATNPLYAEQLINLIESYNLYKIDGSVAHTKHNIFAQEVPAAVQADQQHKVYLCNKDFYTFALPGDDFKKISKELGVSERKLRKYNEVGKDYKLTPGEVVFLQQKQKQADKSFKGFWHTVKPGDSMHSLAQHYAMQMKTLYKTNFRKADYVPQPGDMLLIRK